MGVHETRGLHDFIRENAKAASNKDNVRVRTTKDTSGKKHNFELQTGASVYKNKKTGETTTIAPKNYRKDVDF